MRLQKSDKTLMLPSEIVLGNELELRNKIYTIRGVQAMLDSVKSQFVTSPSSDLFAFAINSFGCFIDVNKTLRRK